jgi:anti-sigma regulatory factor (Ser/Thr protein kinase)
MGALAETAEIVISEVVTNAVAASTTQDPHAWPRQIGLPAIQLGLMSDGTRVVIEVWDANPNAPIVKQADLADESGRGLMLVEALSQRWGWDALPGWNGKVVWVELRAE